MYFSSVLDLCTLNLVSHAFSHRSYCNSQLNCLFACAAFHWPISSKHFSHCGVCTYRTQFVANFSFRINLSYKVNWFFPPTFPHFSAWLLLSSIVIHEVSIIYFTIVMLNFSSCYTQKSISSLFPSFLYVVAFMCVLISFLAVLSQRHYSQSNSMSLFFFLD